MAKLSDLQLASLLEEIGCAMRFGTPIADAMRRLENRRLGRIASVAHQILQSLQRGESASQAIRTISSPQTAQAAAAVEACERNGDPSLLHRMAIQLRQRAELTSSLRLAWFYPFMLMVIGYGVAVLVMAPLIRDIHGRDFQWSPWIVSLARWLDTNWWLPPVVAIVLLLVLRLTLRRRSRFPRNARLGLFFSSLADQFANDVPEDVAIRQAAAFSGDHELMSIADPTLESPAISRKIEISDQLPRQADVTTTKEIWIARLRYMGSIHAARAGLRSYFWSRLMPRVAMVLIGGGFTLAYVWWVIAPAYFQVVHW